MGGSFKEAWEYRHEPEQAHRFATFFWLFSIATSVVLVVLTALFSGWLLLAILGESESNPETAILVTPPPPFDAQELQTAVEFTEMRRLQYDALREDPIRMTDPSR